MPFYRGQKVVYIGPDYRQHPNAIKYCVQIPVPFDVVYTIRSSLLHDLVDGKPGYLLEEIQNSHVCARGQELLIDAKFLRPLVTIKDQAFFTEGAPADTEGLDNRRKTAETVLEFEEYLLYQTRRRAACRRTSS